MDSLTQTAELALKAWEEGEHGGNYQDFKALLSPEFGFFAHPMVAGGTAYGAAALEQMLELMRGQEQNPNHLSFSHPTFSQGVDVRGEPKVVVEFDSEGTLAGGAMVKSRNAIVFGVQDGKITGFREYFGLVDPSWFK